MSTIVRNLEPKEVWNNFSDLNEIPRPSKKEERVIQFMVDFAKGIDLDVRVDETGNVFIKKPASPGMENRKTVVLQSHLDMVCQKNADVSFDFDKEGIKMFVDGDWVKAEGTTLGADNGIGVATIMSILASKTIVHPPLEALFTIDEETGMTGAFGLKAGVLKGDILLNLDTEEDDEIGIGCAGGVDINIAGSYALESLPSDVVAYKIAVTGLNGGHSGMDIIKGLGNANKFMNRVLFALSQEVGIRLSSVDGGSLRNAIPRESFVTLVVDKQKEKLFKTVFEKIVAIIKQEYQTLEKEFLIELEEETSLPDNVMDLESQNKFIKAIYSAHNGVYRMSPTIEGLVETSNNISRVIVSKGVIEIQCLTRSSSETNKMDLANTLKSTFELASYDVGFSGSYPGWQPNVNSEILRLLESTYERMFKEKANVAACHAGLECGILGVNYPEMDMISFGPNIRGAHSPDERVQISSVQKFWKFTLEILRQTPEK